MFFSLENHRSYLGFYIIIGNDIHSFNVETLAVYYSNSEINEDIYGLYTHSNIFIVHIYIYNCVYVYLCVCVCTTYKSSINFVMLWYIKQVISFFTDDE